MQGFTPAFSLTGDNARGIIEVDVELTLNSRSSNSFGFDETLTPAATVRFSGFAFASRLRAAPVYSASADNGVLIGSAVIYFGSGTTLGTVSFRLGRNAQNQVGYFMTYVGASSNQSFSISNNIEAAFLPHDSN